MLINRGALMSDSRSHRVSIGIFDRSRWRLAGTRREWLLSGAAILATTWLIATFGERRVIVIPDSPARLTVVT